MPQYYMTKRLYDEHAFPGLLPYVEEVARHARIDESDFDKLNEIAQRLCDMRPDLSDDTLKLTALFFLLYAKYEHLYAALTSGAKA